MEPRALKAYYDGEQVRPDEECAWERGTCLLFTVVPPEEASEDDDWRQLDLRALASAYGDDETEYSLDMIKEKS